MLNWLQHACTISTDWTMGLAAPFSSFFLCLAISRPTWFSVTQIPYLDYLEAPFLPDDAHLAAAALAAVGHSCCCCSPYLAVCWADGVGVSPIIDCGCVAAVSVFGHAAVNLELPTRFETNCHLVGTIASENVPLDWATIPAIGAGNLAAHSPAAGYLRPSAWLPLAPVQGTVKIDLATA
jgi:hypothetical protein